MRVCRFAFTDGALWDRTSVPGWCVVHNHRSRRAAARTVLFPVRLDDAVLDATSGWATDVNRRFIGNFSAWETPAAYQQALDRLLRDLKAESTGQDAEPGSDTP